MKVDIFIRSYSKDFEYLGYCLRSIARFATGFRYVIVAVPEGQEKQLSHLTVEKVIPVHDGQPGYLGQQVSKLTADLHSNADYFFNLDSDCVLTRPINPKMFMVGDRVRWLVTQWKDVMEAKRTWFHVLCRCVQECPQHEFMRRHGIMVPRWCYEAFRAFIQETHGISMESYVMNVPGHEFSEWNCLGFYLWLHHRDKFIWHDTVDDGLPECPIEQAWSHDNLTQERKNQLAIMLA